MPSKEAETEPETRSTMKTLIRHIKAFAYLLSFAIFFVNSVGAMSMVSGHHNSDMTHSSHHAEPSDELAASHSAHGNMSSATLSHANHECCNTADDSTCEADCAAHCTTSGITGCHLPVANALVQIQAPPLVTSPKSAMISGLYKPPRTLH